MRGRGKRLKLANLKAERKLGVNLRLNVRIRRVKRRRKVIPLAPFTFRREALKARYRRYRRFRRFNRFRGRAKHLRGRRKPRVRRPVNPKVSLLLFLRGRRHLAYRRLEKRFRRTQSVVGFTNTRESYAFFRRQRVLQRQLAFIFKLFLKFKKNKRLFRARRALRRYLVRLTPNLRHFYRDFFNFYCRTTLRLRREHVGVTSRYSKLLAGGRFKNFITKFKYAAAAKTLRCLPVFKLQEKAKRARVLRCSKLGRILWLRRHITQLKLAKRFLMIAKALPILRIELSKGLKVSKASKASKVSRLSNMLHVLCSLRKSENCF